MNENHQYRIGLHRGQVKGALKGPGAAGGRGCQMLNTPLTFSNSTLVLKVLIRVALYSSKKCFG